MFTGIIVARGRLASIEERGGDRSFGIEIPSLDRPLRIGDSVSVQGVCLTVTRIAEGLFYADLSRETLTKTTLAAARVGALLNLEPALRAGDPLGGHLVSGHVDTVGRLAALAGDARSWRMEFEIEPPFARFIAPKGSICLDGVSLTVNNAEGSRFDVNVIPHTFAVTSLGELAVGDRLNVEIDLIARYLDRLIPRN